MHFHLPKPLHGWREFAGEVAIIVLGVLIALGAEQVVETIHWTREAEHTREAISNELAEHYSTAAEIAVAQPCIDLQLLALQQSLLKPGPFVPAQPIHTALGDSAYRAPSRNWADNIWKSAESDGAVWHFDNDLRFRLSAYYAQAALMGSENRATDLLGYRLRLLLLPLQPDASARATLLQAIEEARGHFAGMKLLADQMMGQIDDLGMRPPQNYVDDLLSSSQTIAYCRAHQLALGKAEPQHGLEETVRAYERRQRR